MKFNLNHKIVGVFLLMTALLALIGYFTFTTSNALQKVPRAIMRENVSSLKAAEELEVALLNQKGLVSNFFLDKDTAWLATIEERKKDFDLWFIRAEDAALTANEKVILRDIKALYEIYNQQRNKAIALYKKGDIATARGILLRDMKNTVDDLYQKCEDLILANETLISLAQESSRKHAFAMTALIWVTIAITLSLGAIFGFFIARSINQQLIKSAKMASLGQLSANIAHEIRNPLTSIKMRLYTLGEQFKENSNVKEDMDVISEEINRMEKTVKDFLDFAKPPKISLQMIEIHELLEGVINLLSPKINAQNIQVQKDFKVTLLKVRVDITQVRQVFLNLMLNSIEAMPGGGILRVETKRNDNKAFEPWLEVVISDTGMGMTHEIKNKVFEPFYTTKADGTGLGLFIAARAIKMHKGSIEVESVINKGTAFTIKLPIRV